MKLKRIFFWYYILKTLLYYSSAEVYKFKYSVHITISTEVDTDTTTGSPSGTDASNKTFCTTVYCMVWFNFCLKNYSNQFIAFFILGVRFQKREHAYCEISGESDYRKYDDLEKAKASCAVDPDCKDVYDSKCDNVGPFALCPKSSEHKASGSDYKSCLWVKVISSGK